MILYWLAKVLTNIFFRVYYKVELRGFENIPDKQPVVFAPNHVNAFVDPVLTAMSWKLPKIRFFARGDVFKKPVARVLLNDLNISPVYRIQEGYAEVKKNDKTFEECRQLLAQNKAILIFPEALCIQVRRLRPLKKGLARIVFLTAESLQYKKEIYIIPVGLNYSAPRKFRSSVYVEFGAPVLASTYYEQFQRDKVRATNEFTRFVESRMAAHLVNVQNEANEKLVSDIEEIAMGEWIAGKRGNEKSISERFKMSCMIAESVNRLEAEDPVELKQLTEKILSYQRRLRAHELRDHLLRPDLVDKTPAARFFLEYFLMFLGMPLYLAGMIMNYPPYLAGAAFADGKIANIEFYSSVRANVSMILWLLFYGVQLYIIAIIFKSWTLLGIYALAVPALGFFALKFDPAMRKILGRWRLLRMVRKERGVVEEFVRERSAIMGILSDIMTVNEKINV